MNTKAPKEVWQSAGATAEPSRRRADYVCVDSRERALTFNYLNGSNRADRETVINHLRLCLQCRESAATLIRLGEEIRDRRENNPGDASDEVEDDHGKVGKVVCRDHLPIVIGRLTGACLSGSALSASLAPSASSAHSTGPWGATHAPGLPHAGGFLPHASGPCLAHSAF